MRSLRPENIIGEYQDDRPLSRLKVPSDFCRKTIDCGADEAHNQTRENRCGAACRRETGPIQMDTLFTPVSVPRQEALLRRLDLTPTQISDSRARVAEELAHELRQPLGVIESLAYFLEITADDEHVRGHSQRIQSMVLQANRILQRFCGEGPEAALDAASC